MFVKFPLINLFMLNLILTILFTSWLLIAFRVFDIYKIDHLQAIIFNYIVCAITGFFFFHNYEKISDLNSLDTWIILAIVTGSCFMPTFYLMAYTVKTISVTVSTIASKISLIIPVTVSILYLNKGSELNLLSSLGLVLGICAILLSSIKKEETQTLASAKSRFHYFLPFLVFLGGGLVDVLINITNFNYLPADKSSLFPFFAFSAAAILGLLVLIFRLLFMNEKLKFRNLVGGIVLGIPNYLSIFFLLKALQDFNNNGALIFPILNICVILINAMIALVFFKEKLSRYNYAGLFLAIVSLLLIISN